MRYISNREFSRHVRMLSTLVWQQWYCQLWILSAEMRQQAFPDVHIAFSSICEHVCVLELTHWVSYLNDCKFIVGNPEGPGRVSWNWWLKSTKYDKAMKGAVKWYISIHSCCLSGKLDYFKIFFGYKFWDKYQEVDATRWLNLTTVLLTQKFSPIICNKELKNAILFVSDIGSGSGYVITFLNVSLYIIACRLGAFSTNV